MARPRLSISQHSDRRFKLIVFLVIIYKGTNIVHRGQLPVDGAAHTTIPRPFIISSQRHISADVFSQRHAYIHVHVHASATSPSSPLNPRIMKHLAVLKTLCAPGSLC